MYDIKKKPAVLLLEDGTSFFGVSIGKQGTSGGEICFNTGLTGYQEIYTDPSYYGQIIVNTTSHIGNYGVVSEETESSSVKIKGLVVKTFSDIYSRKTADSSLQDYLDNAGVVGIAEIDTRKLVKHIREKGAMNAIISSEILDLTDLKAKLDEIPSMDGLELSSKVTTKEVVEYISDNEEFKVAVLDLGIKTNILRNFKQRNCSYRVYPASTSFVRSTCLLIIVCKPFTICAATTIGSTPPQGWEPWLCLPKTLILNTSAAARVPPDL